MTEITLPSTMRSRLDYGLKIAKKGFDVRTASDNQLLYNSGFPSLQIAGTVRWSNWEITQNGKAPQWNQYDGSITDKWRFKAQVRHGLGYPPMLICASSDNGQNTGTTLKWNSNYIYVDTDIAKSLDSLKRLTILICPIDISYDIEYPYLDSPVEAEWGQSYDYGLKHTLSGNIDTKSADDLGLNPAVQSSMAVAVKVANGNDSTSDVLYSYTPPLPVSDLAAYPYYQGNDDLWCMGDVSMQQGGVGYRVMTSNGIDRYVIDAVFGNKKASLVIIRQPMVAPAKTRLTMGM